VSRAPSTSDADARVIGLLEQLVAGIDTLVTEMRAANAGPSPLLTREEMAALVRVDLRTLRRLELAGDVPDAIHIGGAKRWKRADVDSWLAGKHR
jgi:predicted DNA-binding transcriptional regulator AlpA